MSAISRPLSNSLDKFAAQVDKEISYEDKLKKEMRAVLGTTYNAGPLSFQGVKPYVRESAQDEAAIVICRSFAIRFIMVFKEAIRDSRNSDELLNLAAYEIMTCTDLLKEQSKKIVSTFVDQVISLREAFDACKINTPEITIDLISKRRAELLEAYAKSISSLIFYERFVQESIIKPRDLELNKIENYQIYATPNWRTIGDLIAAHMKRNFWSIIKDALVASLDSKEFKELIITKLTECPSQKLWVAIIGNVAAIACATPVKEFSVSQKDLTQLLKSEEKKE